MRRYFVENQAVYLEYITEMAIPDRVMEQLTEDELSLAGTFHLTLKDLVQCEDEVFRFKIGEKKGKYYFLNKEIFDIKYDFAYFEDLLENNTIKLKDEMFVQGRYVSVVEKIISSVQHDVFIVNDGGEHNNGMVPVSSYLALIKSFPNPREIWLYKRAVVTSMIGMFFDNQDGIKAYNKFVSKHRDFNINSIDKINASFDIEKYKLIITEIKQMLNGNYSEAQWQKKLLPLICLLYPKYVLCLEKVKIKDAPNHYRELDYLLIDSAGNADIIELKKPFEQCILRKSPYRDNYVPGYELTGCIQQVQKYLFYLNTYKIDNETLIQEHKKNELHGLKIKLINPKGLVFCGRSNEFNEQQRQDYEIIKRQYNSLIDILSYDEIIERLENAIKILKSRDN